MACVINAITGECIVHAVCVINGITGECIVHAVCMIDKKYSAWAHLMYTPCRYAIKQKNGNGLSLVYENKEESESVQIDRISFRGVQFACVQIPKLHQSSPPTATISTNNPVAGGSDHVGHPGVPADAQTETGVVARWIGDHGYGFITPDDGGKDLFVSVTEIKDGYNALLQGKAVTYVKRVKNNKGKNEATQVRGAACVLRTRPEKRINISRSDRGDRERRTMPRSDRSGYSGGGGGNGRRESQQQQTRRHNYSDTQQQRRSDDRRPDKRSIPRSDRGDNGGGNGRSDRQQQQTRGHNYSDTQRQRRIYDRRKR